MTASPEFASQAEAAAAVRGGLGYLAALDPAQLPACEQAELLQLLEQAHALETAARARGLGAFTAAQGYHEDGDYSPRSWLINRTGVTKGAATAYLDWARRADAHPRVLAALAARDISESFARTICDWTGQLPAGLPGLRRRDPGRGRAVRGQPGGPGPAGRGDLRPVPAPGPATARTTGSRTGRSGWRPPSRAPGSSAGTSPPSAPRWSARCWTPCRPPRGPGTCGRTGSGTTTRCRTRCSACSGAGLLPGRAGQPVRAWAHMSLAELLALDGDGALLGQWTDAVRARWAGHRAAASVAGSDGAAWLDGAAAAAVACDALISPVVTGDVDPGALDGLVRLCVELDRLGPGTGPGDADPDDADPARPGRGPRAAAAAAAGPCSLSREALERAIIGKAVELLSGPGGLASLPAPPAARRPAGRAQPPPGHRLQRHRPRRHPPRRHPARPALPVGRRLHPARRRLPGPPRPPQGQRRPHQRQGLHTSVLFPSPGGHPPLGLDSGPEPGRDHHRLEPRPDQGPAQPQPARPGRVTPPGRCSRGAGWCCSRSG